MQEPIITFVVPAYNVEMTVSECLDSLLEQTLIAHKIIIVNDGSTDSTGTICEEYARKYPSIIQYFYQTNAGLSAARNRGLENVTTELVTFLDSDDIQDRKFVEKLLDYLRSVDVLPDLILTVPTIYDVSSNRTIEWYDEAELNSIVKVNVEGINQKQYRKTVIASDFPWLYSLEVNACRKIFSAHYLKNEQFSFPEGLIWEDIPSHFWLIHNANSIGILLNTGFIYRINSGQQITSGRGKGRLDIIPIFNQLYDIISNDDWSLIERAFGIRLIVSFTKWFIDVTDVETIDELLKDLHVFYKKIPNQYFTAYFDTCSPHRRTEMLLVAILRSPFYEVYKDYQTKESLKNMFYRIRRISRVK